MNSFEAPAFVLSGDEGARRMKGWARRLIGHSKPSRGSVAGLTLLALAGAVLEALKPWPLKLAVDNVLGSRPLSGSARWIGSLPGADSPGGLIAWLAAGTVLLVLVAVTVKLAQEYIQSGAGSRMAYDLGRRLFEHLQALSLRFHGRRKAGDLVRRVTQDSGCVRDLLTRVYVPVVTAVAGLVVMFVVMWRLDPVLALVSVGAAVPLAMVIRLFARPMAERQYEQQQLQGEIMAHAEQTLSALPVVQAFGREEREDTRLRALSGRTVQASLRATTAELGFKFSSGGVTAVGMALIMVVGGFHVLDGRLTVGGLVVFLSYAVALYGPLETIAYVSEGYAAAAASARRVLEILDTEEMVRDLPGAAPLPEQVRGHVRLEAVTFGYEPGRPVLHGIDLEALPGETVALVGRTGSGKSTLVSLIPRFFDPWEGRVTLGGRDVREVPLADLRSRVALVLQEPFLLPLTVAENIAYGREGATPEQVRAAARAANADSFIRNLPAGYDTVIGERGATLSGGEKQRIAIARALLKDAPVLILDEPTSALDAQTESLLLEALERLMAGRTTFIIAHRLSTIRRADRIAVVEEGRIVEEGSHAELMERDEGIYRRSHQLQLVTGATEASG